MAVHDEEYDVQFASGFLPFFKTPSQLPAALFFQEPHRENLRRLLSGSHGLEKLGIADPPVALTGRSGPLCRLHGGPSLGKITGSM